MIDGLFLIFVVGVIFHPTAVRWICETCLECPARQFLPSLAMITVSYNRKTFFAEELIVV